MVIIVAQRLSQTRDLKLAIRVFNLSLFSFPFLWVSAMNLADLSAMVAVLAEKVVHLEQQDRHRGVESVADLASRVLHLEELQQFTENHPPPPAATTVSPGSTAWVSSDDENDPKVLRAMIDQLTKDAEQQEKKY